MRCRIRSLLLAAAAASAFASLAAPAAPLPADEQVSLGHARTASVGGLWCGVGLLTGFTLEIAQHTQDFQAKLLRKGRVREITGHVDGSRVVTDPQKDHTMELLAEGNQLRIVGATGVLALATGQAFQRAAGGSCTG